MPIISRCSHVIRLASLFFSINNIFFFSSMFSNFFFFFLDRITSAIISFIHLAVLRLFTLSSCQNVRIFITDVNYFFVKILNKKLNRWIYKLELERSYELKVTVINTYSVGQRLGIRCVFTGSQKWKINKLQNLWFQKVLRQS